MTQKSLLRSGGVWKTLRILRNIIVFDLEGPLSPQDNAFELMARYVKNGGKLFSVVSRYDDLLTLVNREGYEPGDTLELIVPFLVDGGVKEADIQAVSAQAALVPGIKEFFAELQEDGVLVWIISTSYQQHALSIAQRLGLPKDQVFCTKFQLDLINRDIPTKDLALIREVREKATALYCEDLESGASDEAMLKLLNRFYWEELPKTRFGQIGRVEVMGGRRKVKALEQAMMGYYLNNAFVVMDSITDFRMAQVTEAAGGMAVAWNANWFVLPYASCGVAAVDGRAVQPVFKAWREGGRKAVREFIASAHQPNNPEAGPYYHWLAGQPDKAKEQIVLPIHRRLRTACRKEAAKLG